MKRAINFAWLRRFVIIYMNIAANLLMFSSNAESSERSDKNEGVSVDYVLFNSVYKLNEKVELRAIVSNRAQSAARIKIQDFAFVNATVSRLNGEQVERNFEWVRGIREDGARVVEVAKNGVEVESIRLDITGKFVISPGIYRLQLDKSKREFIIEFVK